MARLKCWALAALCVLLGCRAAPAPDAGFLKDTHLMKKDPDVPYNRIYLDPNNDETQYTEIYLAPVNIDHLLPLNLWELANTTDLFPHDIRKNHRLLARYTRSAFIKAIQEDPSKRFVVVDQPGPHALILEMGLVQLVPDKPLLNISQFISWIPYVIAFGMPIVTHSEDQGQGVIAMEARLRDGATGNVIGRFADREHPAFSIVSIKALFWWEPLKPMIDGWARQFVAMENGVKGKENKEIPMFQILVL